MQLGLRVRSLNGPDFGPYFGQKIFDAAMNSLHVSTGLTSAHISDQEIVGDYWSYLGLNGPDFGPYFGRQFSVDGTRKRGVSTGLTSAHISDHEWVCKKLREESQRA